LTQKSRPTVAPDVLKSVKALINQAYKYSSDNPLECLALSRKALMMSVENDFAVGRGVSLSHVGIAYYHLDDLPRAMKLYEEAEAVLSKEEDVTAFLSMIVNNKGLIYYSWSMNSEALRCFEKSLDLIDPDKQPRDYIFCINNIASTIHNQENDSPRLLELYSEAYVIALKHRINDVKGMISNNIAMRHLHISDSSQALFWAKKSLKYSLKCRSNKSLILSYNGLANVYLVTGNFLQARKKVESALVLAKEMKSINSLAELNRTLAKSYQNEPKKALQILKETLKILEKTDFIYHKSKTLYSLYELYKSEKRYKMALKYYEDWQKAKHEIDHAAFEREKVSSIYLIELQQKRKETETLKAKNAQIERINRKIDAQKRDLMLVNRRYEQLAVESGSFIWETDDKGQFTYVSSSVFSVLGYKPKELIGKKMITDLSPTEDRDRMKTLFTNTLVKQKSLKNQENRLICNDGSMIWVLSNGLSIVDDMGNPCGFRGVNLDITARKEAVAALNATNQELNMAYRSLQKTQQEMIALEQKNAVLATIVTANHEINQPLTIAIGNLELLQNKLKNNPHQKLIDKVQNALKRIDAILTKLRRIDKIKMTSYLGETNMLDIENND